MTLIPISELVMTDKEKRDHLVFLKNKLQSQVKTERQKYLRDQYLLQIASIDKQLRELKPKLKNQNLQSSADRVNLAECFMWEAKAFLVKPMYDKIMENAWKRMRITQKLRLEGK